MEGLRGLSPVDSGYRGGRRWRGPRRAVSHLVVAWVAAWGDDWGGSELVEVGEVRDGGL